MLGLQHNTSPYRRHRIHGPSSNVSARGRILGDKSPLGVTKRIGAPYPPNDDGCSSCRTPAFIAGLCHTRTHTHTRTHACTHPHTHTPTPTRTRTPTPHLCGENVAAMAPPAPPVTTGLDTISSGFSGSVSCSHVMCIFRGSPVNNDPLSSTRVLIRSQGSRQRKRGFSLLQGVLSRWMARWKSGWLDGAILEVSGVFV